MNTTDLRFDTGRLCLDLTATVGAGLSTNPVERLPSPDVLDQWLIRAGLLPREHQVQIDEQWLTRLRELRVVLDRVAHDQLLDRIHDDDLTRLNDYAAADPPRIRIGRDGASFTARSVDVVSVDAVASVISRDMIALLAGNDRDRMRQCDGAHCRLVYLDTSRGGRRRWCSGSGCGNRERVARHRERVHTR